MPNIDHLIKKLEGEKRFEDIAIFSALAEAGWNIEKVPDGYVWANYTNEPKEEVGPYEEDEEIISAGRIIFNQNNNAADLAKLSESMTGVGWALRHEHNVWFCENKTAGMKTNVWFKPQDAIEEAEKMQTKYEAEMEGQTSTPTQEEVIEKLASQPGTEHFSDHEVDLRKQLVEWLKAEGVEVRCDVACSAGVADVVTEDAIYEVRHELSLATLASASDKLVYFWRELIHTEQLNEGADAIIITCCPQDLSSLKAAAEDVAVMTFEELTQPSTPEFIESLFTQIREITTVSAFKKLIEDNSLQDVTVDTRFTPSQRTELHEALNECNVRVYQVFSEPNPSTDILMQQMDPKDVSTHPSLLMRASGLDVEHVAELEAGYRAGKTYPPADIFYDGDNYWVADGNHRHAGALRAGKLLDVKVHEGTLREAILFALRSNTEHGLKLTNDDKRLKAVTLLADPEWFKESDTILAGIANVTQQFISGVRRDLAQILPALQSDMDRESDESLAGMLSVSAGLVRVVRRIPLGEREALTQNVLSDDGRRRGADGVVRSTPTRTVEAEKKGAPLFPEQSDDAVSNVVSSDVSEASTTAAPPDEPDEAAQAHGESVPAQDSLLAPSEEPATEDAKPSGGATEESTTARVAETEQFSPSFRLTTLLKQHPEGMTTEEVLAEGFTMNDINQARTAREIERHENGRCFYAWKTADVVSALEERGTLSRLELEDLGCQSYVINAALSEGLISQPETGKFSLPKRVATEAQLETRSEVSSSKPAASTTHHSSPQTQETPKQRAPVGSAIERGLKGRKMILGFTFIPGLKGKVQATVNVGDNVKSAGRELFSVEELVLPERTLCMIEAQIGGGFKLPRATSATTTSSNNNTEEEPSPKVTRILSAIGSAKTSSELDKHIKHYKLDDLSRFDRRDVLLIQNALKAQKKKLVPARTAKSASRKTAPKRATKKPAGKSASKVAKKGASKGVRARS